jgi:type II pantothenate kinase
MMKQELFWLQAFLFGASCIAGLIITRKRKLHRLHLHVLSSKPFDFGKYFGVDIGGTLAKMVYFQPSKSSSSTDFTQERLYLSNLDEYILNLKSSDGSRTAERDERLELHVDALGGTLHFCSFQTSRMEKIVETIRNRFFHRYIRTISCTGGGAYKFSRLFEDTLGIFIQKADEMDALIQGLNFVLRYAKNECYTFKNVSLDAQGLGEATKKLMPMPTNHHEIYPFLLVNIGSGVSILKVTSETQYERVSGTSLGGGTFWGLCRTLSKFRSFEEAMDASVEGNSSSVDMTVSLELIYGGPIILLDFAAD